MSKYVYTMQAMYEVKNKFFILSADKFDSIIIKSFYRLNASFLCLKSIEDHVKLEELDLEVEITQHPAPFN